MTARLGGRVALVTGAGRGLGRAHAHALARDGALVVVNDLGTALDGSGTDSGPAEAVANEITATGGRAVADTTDVASIQGGVAAVLVALDAYGRIDIVVNNAGFAHGGGEVEHPIDAELDALFGVHYKAALGTISAAFGPMRAQASGESSTPSPRSRSTLGWPRASATDPRRPRCGPSRLPPAARLHRTASRSTRSLPARAPA